MDLTKRYHTSDLRPCDITELINKEPEAVAEMIQEYERRIKDGEQNTHQDRAE